MSLLPSPGGVWRLEIAHDELVTRLGAFVVEHWPQRTPAPSQLVAGTATLFLVKLHAGEQQRNLCRRQLLRVVTSGAGGLRHLHRQQRVVPEGVVRLGIAKRGRRSLPVMADGASEAIHGMLIEDARGVDTVGQRDIRHSRIVNPVVAGDAAVHRPQRRQADLFQLDVELGQQFAPALVRCFFPEDFAVLALYRAPLRQIVLVYRGAHQVNDGETRWPAAESNDKCVRGPSSHSP